MYSTTFTYLTGQNYLDVAGFSPSPPAPPGGYLPPMNDELWTIDDVSDFLKVPKATLYNWNHLRGGPRPLKVGGHCVGGRRRSSTG